MQAILRIYSKFIRITAEKEKSLLYDYFIIPFSAGLTGFAIFLFILILLEASAYLFGISRVFNIGLNDVLIAVLGFLLQFTYHLIKSGK